MKFQKEHSSFHSKSLVSKCRLQNGGHFVSVSLRGNAVECIDSIINANAVKKELSQVIIPTAKPLM